MCQDHGGKRFFFLLQENKRKERGGGKLNLHMKCKKNIKSLQINILGQ